MEKRTWAKIIILLLLIGGIAIGLYIQWGTAGLGSDPLSAWGRGNPTASERTYYASRINRIIEEWENTSRRADYDKNGRYKDSYQTLFVVDLDEQAVWIEENGRPRKNDYSKLPLGIKWRFHHVTPDGKKELTGRIALKMRGRFTSRHEPERFFLIGTGRGSGHFNFQFYAHGGRGNYSHGPFRPQPFSARSSKKSEDPYGSILVTDSEYARYRANDTNPALQTVSKIEENKANWLRAEKAIYGRIERNVRKAGFEPYHLKVEPGPDFSAGHAEIRGRNSSALRGFFGGSSSMEAYLKIDYLGNDVWCAKSARHPQRPIMPRRILDLEFLVHPTAEITNSQRKDLLAKGRKLQQFELTAPSKWKATLANGATVEFIGICENPSAGKQWWGPDGSPLDYVPYINTEPYSQPRTDRKLYEFAWRINYSSRGGSATRYSFEGSKGSYYRQVRDRYGNRIIEGLRAEAYGFEKSRRKTTWSYGLATGNWQIPLVIEDKAGETKFLDKQRIILNPPKIENGKIVVRCFVDYRSHIRDYHTDFALILWEDSAKKTVSLNRYSENTSDDRETGLREHKFTIEDVSMSQIEGVCFRYRPFSFVKFKNISLVPGEDQGFEIELGQ